MTNTTVTPVEDSNLPGTPEYGQLYVGFDHNKVAIGKYYGYYFQKMLYGMKLFYDVFFILDNSNKDCIKPDHLYIVPPENERAVRNILKKLKSEPQRPKGIIEGQPEPKELLPLLVRFWEPEQPVKPQKTFELDFKGHEIQVLEEQDQILFRANDVCEALEYKNARDAISNHVELSDVVKRDTRSSSKAGSTQMRQTNYITESGLYCLIFGSKKPSAKEFKLWVTREVLPQIRKTGKYAPEVGEQKSGIREQQPRLGPEVYNLQYQDHSIQVVKQEGQFFYKAKEVIEALGYSNKYSVLSHHVPQQHIRKICTTVQNRQGFPQNYTSNFLTESGMHCLVLKCTKPGALALHSWITEDVPNLARDEFTLDPMPLEVSSLKQFACY